MFNRNPSLNPIQPQYPQYSQNFSQFIPSTNKRFVHSLEEALSLPADFNSQNVYFDFNKNVMYDICTNGQGEKSWTVFEISLKQSSAKTAPENDWEQRFRALENKLEELMNGKYNGKPADATNASAG